MKEEKLAKGFFHKLGAESAPALISEEEQNPSIQYDQSPATEPVESMDEIYAVNYKHPDESGCSEFSFFEDGRQRTVQVAHVHKQIGDHHITVPIHFFIVAAVILKREDRKLKLWGRAKVRKGILVAKSLLSEAVVAEYEDLGLIIEDTEKEQQAGESAVDYYDLKRRALQRSKSLRLEAEQDLISEWRESDESRDGFLVVDGTLMNLRNERNVDRCVGVSKSFGTRFSNQSDYNRVMGMKEFERSWTFRFHDPESDLRKGPRERVSWYLRLRSGKNKGPEFGLVRVEMSKKYMDDSTAYANRFSRWLLSERLPTSYPSPRWDKHLYPITACENYLSSIMPSTKSLNASMRG